MGCPLLFAGLVTATFASGVQLEPEAGADCPPPDALARRLTARVPAAPPADGRAGEAGAWRLRYRTGPPSPPSGRRTISLELLDAAGHPRLRRTLPVEPTECPATAATAITAIVERFFRDIGWTSAAPLPSPAPAPAPAPVPAPVPARAAPPPATPPPSTPGPAPPPPPVPTTPTRPPPTRSPPPATATNTRAATPGPRPTGGNLTIAAGPTVWLAGQPHLRAALAVRGELAALPAALTLGTLLPAARSRESAAGAAMASQTAWPLRLTASALLRRPALELDGGLDLVATLDSAASAGISAPDARTRVSLAAGVAVGAALRLAGAWSLHAGLAGHRHLAGSRFFIQAETTGQRLFVLDRPRWQGLVTLALAYRFGW